jgi:DNA-binding NtrC family response regulator
VAEDCKKTGPDLMDARILVADDDPQQRRYIAAVLSASGYSVSCVDGGRSALDRLVSDSASQVDLLLLDLQMPDIDGIEVLHTLRARDVGLPILVLTSDGSVSRAVDAMRAGANDFLIKPVGPERLDVSIRNALAISDLSTEVRRLSRAEENRLSFGELISVAASTRDAIAMARRAARSEIPILIEGESGTGKEVFARAIHGSSARAGAPFIAVNCGALPAQLVESILFGHEKGAFTGATTRRAGKFQEATGGTLFLDEIGELSAAAQAKLLQFLQDRTFERVGGLRTQKADVRLVAATNRDLEEEVEQGRFRRDLYFRIAGVVLTIPPLRERRADIGALVDHFLPQFNKRYDKTVRLSDRARDALVGHEWTGNGGCQGSCRA